MMSSVLELGLHPCESSCITHHVDASYSLKVGSPLKEKTSKMYTCVYSVQNDVFIHYFNKLRTYYIHAYSCVHYHNYK